jgi:hypothetical protein
MMLRMTFALQELETMYDIITAEVLDLIGRAYERAVAPDTERYSHWSADEDKATGGWAARWRNWSKERRRWTPIRRSPRYGQRDEPTRFVRWAGFFGLGALRSRKAAWASDGGRVHRFAELLDLQQSTVNYWATSGFIPRKRHARIIEVATERGITISPTELANAVRRSTGRGDRRGR